jgi:hypothetical protein
MPSLLKFISFLAMFSVGTLTLAQGPPKELSVFHHARGTFEVSIQPRPAPDIGGVACFSSDKTIHGDLEATSKGEMFSAGDPKAGNAGYVAIETVNGKLEGKSGSFVLQHFATMDASGRDMIVKVSPGSGTGELKGISGTFTIIIEGGKHSYDFEYKLANGE